MIWIPPGQKRWHGATTTAGMTHIGIVDPLDGKVVEWMEKVSEEQYRRTLVLLGQNLEELAQVLPEAAVQHFPATLRKPYCVVLALPPRVDEALGCVHGKPLGIA